MSTDNAIILEAFNEQFVDFIKDIQAVFPDEENINRAKNYILGIVRIDKKMLILVWKHYVINKPEYAQAVEEGNIDFFIEKDYNEDLKHLKSAQKVAAAIDDMRGKIKLMERSDLEKTIEYMQNLTTLSINYVG